MNRDANLNEGSDTAMPESAGADAINGIETPPASAATARAILISRRCSDDACRQWSHVTVTSSGKASASCPGCGVGLEIDVPASLIGRREVEHCPACGGEEFFLRKDFPQKAGFALVVVFGLVASVFYFYENVLATFAVLGSLVVIDAIIYLFVGRVTVCYKCRIEFRQVTHRADHKGFDLATAEKYRES